MPKDIPLPNVDGSLLKENGGGLNCSPTKQDKLPRNNGKHVLDVLRPEVTSPMEENGEPPKSGLADQSMLSKKKGEQSLPTWKKNWWSLGLNFDSYQLTRQGT